MNRPTAIPQDLWDVLPPETRMLVDREDPGYRGYVPSGPYRCDYFTLWDRAGRAVQTWDRADGAWTLRKPAVTTTQDHEPTE